MQRGSLVLLAFGAFVTAIAACSDGSPTIAGAPSGTVAQQATGGHGSDTSKGGGKDTTKGGGKDTTSRDTTSKPPADTFVINPPQAAILVGSTIKLTAVQISHGTVTNPPVTWQSGNTAVATVDATGLVTGVARGGTLITATFGGRTASTAVAVLARSDSNLIAPGVPSFDLVTRVIAPTPTPGDTTGFSNAPPVAGVTIHLIRTQDAQRNILPTPVDAGSGTTSADGTASFHNLVGGAYLIEVRPPAGSPFGQGYSQFLSVPMTPAVAVTLALWRQ